MKYPEAKLDFEGKVTIHGVHASIKEASRIAEYWGYLNQDEEVTKVEHVYATWGRLPSDIEDGDIKHGWWIVPNGGHYKHIKKVTYVTIITE